MRNTIARARPRISAVGSAAAGWELRHDVPARMVGFDHDAEYFSPFAADDSRHLAGNRSHALHEVVALVEKQRVAGLDRVPFFDGRLGHEPDEIIRGNGNGSR